MVVSTHGLPVTSGRVLPGQYPWSLYPARTRTRIQFEMSTRPVPVPVSGKGIPIPVTGPGPGCRPLVGTHDNWYSTVATRYHPWQLITTCAIWLLQWQLAVIHGNWLSPIAFGCQLSPTNLVVTHDNQYSPMATGCHPWHPVVTCGIWLLQWQLAVKYGNWLSPIAFGCHLRISLSPMTSIHSQQPVATHGIRVVSYGIWLIPMTTVFTHGNRLPPMASGLSSMASGWYPWQPVFTHGNRLPPMASSHIQQLVVAYGIWL